MKIQPKITEKTMHMAANANTYTFEVVGGDLSRQALVKMVETEYKVEVVSVNTSNRLGKSKRAGKLRKQYKRSDSKIYFLKLKEGDKIKDFIPQDKK
jgi:ribosomal protein L23